jgi:hypothetical protein
LPHAVDCRWYRHAALLLWTCEEEEEEEYEDEEEEEQGDAADDVEEDVDQDIICVAVRSPPKQKQRR